MHLDIYVASDKVAKLPERLSSTSPDNEKGEPLRSAISRSKDEH